MSTVQLSHIRARESVKVRVGLIELTFVILFRIRLGGCVGLARARPLLDLEYATLSEAALERAEFAPLAVVRVNAAGKDRDAGAAARQGVQAGAAAADGDVFAGSAGLTLLLLLLRRGARDHCVGRAATLVCALVAIHGRAVEGKDEGEFARVAIR